jgi:hypothetical protein
VQVVARDKNALHNFAGGIALDREQRHFRVPGCVVKSCETTEEPVDISVHPFNQASF